METRYVPAPTDPVSLTVYSVVWPETRALVLQCFQQEAERMLERHDEAFTKKQDALHAPFFEAWQRFVRPAVAGLEAFPYHYPCAGSSEAIREIIREMVLEDQTLVVFEGDYEGYDAIAQTQLTPVVRVDRRRWRETVVQWQREGFPWGDGGARWWVSQPSAIDGNVWAEFQDWLDAMDGLPNCKAWVDLTYVGRARLQATIDLTNHPAVMGVVFSLSKVMGAYYRRIGGCLSREPLPGLWANQWFKNLDSLYLGQRWLEGAGDAVSQGQRYRELQARAMAVALEALGGEQAWQDAGVSWKPSDVGLLMHADPTEHSALWAACRRGPQGTASARLCLTPTLERLLQENPHVA